MYSSISNTFTQSKQQVRTHPTIFTSMPSVVGLHLDLGERAERIEIIDLAVGVHDERDNQA
jgi:hypothetical protein